VGKKKRLLNAVQKFGRKFSNHPMTLKGKEREEIKEESIEVVEEKGPVEGEISKEEEKKKPARKKSTTRKKDVGKKKTTTRKKSTKKKKITKKRAPFNKDQ
jgi:hypothetical protein